MMPHLKNGRRQRFANWKFNGKQLDVVDIYLLMNFLGARHFANFCLLIPKSYGCVVMWILVDNAINLCLFIPKTYGC
jgi:hypothetical protein